MDLALIIIFMLLGIGFFILEIFFLPGVTIGGVAGTIFTIASVWYAFAKMGSMVGWLTISLGLIIFLITLFVFIKSKVLEKMSLKKELDGSCSFINVNKVSVGDRGKTISRLAPMGQVLVNELMFEGKSRDELIDAGTPIEVIEKEGQTLIVKRIENN